MLRRCLLLTVLGLGAVAPSAHAAITVSAPSVTEGGTLVYTVTRDNVLEAATADTGVGSAGASTDYTARTGVAVPFGLGMSAEVEVVTLGDTAPEVDETVPLVVDGTLSDPVTGVGTIVDDDPPSLAVFAAKGPEGQGFVDVPVGRTPVSRATTVTWTAAPGTAGAEDLAAATGSVTLPPGAGAGTIRVPVVNDAEDEADETFTVTIASAGATLAAASAVATIANDDLRAITVGDATVTEGDGAATLVRVPVQLSAPTTKPVTAQFATVDLTAKAGKDYTARTGSVTFAPGQVQQTIDVAIVSDDVIEKQEQFAVLVGREVNATTARGTALVKVDDDDASQGDDTAPDVKVAAPRRSGSRAISVRVTCPKGEQRCSSRVTLYTRPDRTSRVRTLRTERRIASRTVTLRGGQTRTLRLAVPQTLVRSARRARRLKVRAFVVTTDANDNQDTTERSATLRFR